MNKRAGGGKRILGGASKTVFGEGFYGMFSPAIKTPFSQTLHFMGKLAISRERESYFQGKLSLRGKIFPLRGNSPNFPSKNLLI